MMSIVWILWFSAISWTGGGNSWTSRQFYGESRWSYYDAYDNRAACEARAKEMLKDEIIDGAFIGDKVRYTVEAKCRPAGHNPAWDN